MARTLKNQPGGWLPIAWEEYIGKDASHGTSFSTGWDGGSQITFEILINWGEALDAELALLGSAVFTGPPLNILHRTLPARHPMKPAYYCERILSATPVRWDTKIQDFTSTYITGSTGTSMSEYQFFHLVLGFHVPKYRILSDADLLGKYGSMQEWRRWTEIATKPSTQVISRDASLWQWDDATPGIGKALTAPVGTPIYSAEWHVKWRRLPRKGVFANSGDNDSFNANIISSYNKVHNGATNLWGMTGNANTGVLRLVSVEAESIPSPFDPVIQGLSLSDINTYVDLNMVFHEWRPPAGNVSNQGHNLAPYTDNLWYLIKTANGGNRVFQMSDLTTAFSLSLT